MNNINDETIISTILKKNEQGINLVIDKYGSLIYGVLREKLKNLGALNEIEDIFYTIILKIWEATENYDSTRGSYRNFIITIAKYSAIDYIRSKKFNEVSMEDYMLNNLKKEDNIEVIEKESFDDIIESLNDIDKEIFVKKYYFDESIDSIALDLGKSRDYIYNRLSRGRKKLLESRRGVVKSEGRL